MSADLPGVDPHDGVTEPAEVKPPGFFKRLHARAHRNPVTGLLFKVFITLLGGALVIAGVIMIFTPGQGILGIIFGLGLLSLEYQWAERALDKAKAKAQAAKDKFDAGDPAVRRRRVWIVIAVFMSASFLFGVYLASYGYPDWMNESWTRAQDLVAWLPELPDLEKAKLQQGQ